MRINKLIFTVRYVCILNEIVCEIGSQNCVRSNEIKKLNLFLCFFLFSICLNVREVATVFLNQISLAKLSHTYVRLPICVNSIRFDCFIDLNA